MNAITHTNTDVEEMARELPMRIDLASMPLNGDIDTAKAQILMRQAVAVPLNEMVTNQIKDWIEFLLGMMKKK